MVFKRTYIYHIKKGQMFPGSRGTISFERVQCLARVFEWDKMSSEKKPLYDGIIKYCKTHVVADNSICQHWKV